MHAILIILHAGDEYHFTWTSTPVHHFQTYSVTTAPQNSICLQGTTQVDKQKAATLHEHVNTAAQTLNLGQATPRPRSQAPSFDADSAFIGLGKLLFGQLVPDQIQQQIRSLPAGSTLQIATNDVNLPWELLHDGDDFLALQHCVARLPMLEKPQPQHKISEHDARPSSLLLGNPTGDLPEAAHEIKAIADILYAARDRVSYRALYGDHISAIHLQELLAQQAYNLIHFAGHARPGALRLAKEDFRVDDILKSLHNHPVVVLNACATGRADSAAPDLSEMTSETQSLASAFIQAGATAVVAMLWPIPDATSKLFAETLYRRLVTGESIGEALQHSRIRLRQHDPKGISWLAPVLYGNPQQRVIPAALKESSGTLLALRFPEPLVDQRKGLSPTPSNQAPHLALLCQRITHHAGIVLQANEAGLLAAFGLHQASTSNAVQAILAARDAVALAASWHVALPAIALVSGDLATTQQENRGRRAADVAAAPLLFGPPVREAQHYLESASPGQILLNQLAHDRAQDRFHCRPWRGSTASGHTIAGYELISAPVELPVDTLMLNSGVFVGRKRESQQLEEAWQAARQGHGQVVNISGEAGIGKTHLVQAFQKTLAPDAAHWIQVICTAQTQNTPYGLLTRLLRTLLTLPDYIDESELDTVLHTRFAQHPSDDTALLVDLLGTHQQTLPRQEQSVYQHQLYRLLVQLLLRQTEQTPVILVLEDTHLSDSASIDVFTLLVNHIEDCAILLLLPHRPEWQPPWHKKDYFQSIALKQLDRPTRQRLYEALLRASQLPNELLNLVERASGNPLFLTQILVTLMNKGLLTTKENATPQWQLSGLLEPRDLPDSVQLIIDMRLDRLDTEVRNVLAVAAVLGSTITPETLLWGSSITEELLFTHLKTLTNEDLLRHDPIHDCYEFRHDLIRDVVYMKIPVPQRQLWHRQVADALSQRDTRRRESVALLAHHYYHSLLDGGSPDQPRLNRGSDGAVVEKALDYLVQSGQDALDRYGGHEAVTLFRRAKSVQELLSGDVKLLAHIHTDLGHAYSQINKFAQAAPCYAEAHAALHRQPLTVETRPQVAHLARLLARLYMRWAEYAMAEAWIETGLERVRNVEDAACQSAAALLHIHAGSISYDRGSLEHAIANCQMGLELAQAFQDQAAQAEGNLILGAVMQTSGRYAESLDYYRRSLAFHEQQQNLYQIHRVAGNIGVVYYSQGDWPQALEYYQRASNFWQEIGELDLLAIALLNTGLVELCLGNYTRAYDQYEQALIIWQNMESQRWLARCHSNLGSLFVEQESWPQAAHHLTVSQQLIDKHDIRDLRPDVLCGQALVAAASQQLEAALALARQAEQVATDQTQELEKALALRVQGQILCALQDFGRAIVLLEQSQRSLTELGAQYESARTILQLALARELSNEMAEALTLCNQATMIFATLGAQRDLERANALHTRVLPKS